MIKPLLSVVLVVILSGCASNLKSSTWVAIRESPTQFDQAIAKCEYDIKLIDKDSERLKLALMGFQHPTFEACMKVQGYEWMRISDTEVTSKNMETKAKIARSEKDEDAIKIAGYRAGVEKGDANSEINLAYRYYNGNGLTQSFTQAYKLYARAAEKVEANKQAARNAQVNLGNMYVSGHGVEIDLVRAMMWFELSAYNGDKDAQKKYTELRVKSSPYQIKMAKRLTAFCGEKNFKNCDEPLSSGWNICDVANVLASTPSEAKDANFMNIDFSFRKNEDLKISRLYIFFKDSPTRFENLQRTDDGFVNGSEKFKGYASVDKKILVQELERQNLIITLKRKDESDTTFFAKCSE